MQQLDHIATGVTSDVAMPAVDANRPARAKICAEESMVFIVRMCYRTAETKCKCMFASVPVAPNDVC